MIEILNKLYTQNSQKAVCSVLDTYEKQWFAISNFIYFSNIKSQKLFEKTKKNTIQKEYYKSLMKWDFLFPDGIALQIFYALAQKRFNLPTKKIHNLNWTDFVPYFLEEIKKRYGSQRIFISLYWSKNPIVNELTNILNLKWFNVIYSQDWYSEFDWKSFWNTEFQSQENPIKILLVARSTPNNPIQELRTLKNYSKIKENNLMVFTVWGLFDFMVADKKNLNSDIKKLVQKRAPSVFRKAKLERFRRFITDPKRNYKKIKNSLSIFPYIFKYLLLKKD